MASATVSDQQTLGQCIHRLRTRLELRQQDIADTLGIPRSAVSLLESGQRHLSLDEATRLADLFGVSLDTLAGRSTAQVDAYDIAFRAGWEAGHEALAKPIADLLLATRGMSEDRTARTELLSGARSEGNP